MEILLGAILVAVALFAAGTAYFKKKRREALFAKYADNVIVEKIMRGLVWQGMSEAQLLDSWGQPVARDQKLYKTKAKYTFKYNRTGKNRFSNRVYVENGIVVGWEKK